VDFAFYKNLSLSEFRVLESPHPDHQPIQCNLKMNWSTNSTDFDKEVMEQWRYYISDTLTGEVFGRHLESYMEDLKIYEETPDASNRTIVTAVEHVDNDLGCLQKVALKP